MNIKKNAFTLSEALVTLAILGVLAAILIPVLDNVRPDKDRIMYKKAMYAMQGAVSSVMDEITAVATNTNYYWADAVAKDSVDFCEKVAGSLNTTGRVRCGDVGQSWENAEAKAKGESGDTAEPDFITTDGIMWWGLAKYKFGTDSTNPNEANSEVHNIYVTRKDQYNSDGSMKDGNAPLKIQVRYDGRVGTGEGADWAAENDFLEDSLNLQKKKNIDQYKNEYD